MTTFEGTHMNITTEGRPQLGAALGTPEYVQQFVSEKVIWWCKGLEKLATIADTQPHATYAALTRGLVSKWTYLFRIIPDINSILDPLELTLRTKFIPAFTGRPTLKDQECNLFALPIHSPQRSWLDESSETVCYGVLCLSKDLWTLGSLYYPADP